MKRIYGFLIVLGALLLAFAAWSIVMPQSSERIECAKSLVEVNRALQAYLNNHNGRYPDSINSLVSLNLLSREYETCRGNEFILNVSGRMRSELPESFIAVYGPKPEKADTWVNVLYVGGWIEPLLVNAAQEKLESPAIHSIVPTTGASIGVR